MDYSSLGTVTGACHAPVAGGQGKAPRIPVPIEKPADFEMDGREDFQNSLCLWAAALKQIRLLKGWRSRRGFCKVGTTFKPRQACLQKQGCRTHLTCCVDSTRKSWRLPQEPHPPRRAHDTLQPQDESIIVGYYTSAEVLPRKLPRPAQSEIRR